MTHLSSSSGPFDPWLERRLTAAAILVLVAWGGLFGRLFYLQVVQGDPKSPSATP